MKQLLIISILAGIFVFQSCSYKLSKVETVSGEKIWVRYYHDYDERFDYDAKCLFNGYNKEIKFEKYNKLIFSDTIGDLTFFQFDSIRIYITNNSIQFKEIFLTGLISPKTFYCELDSSCLPPQRETDLITDILTGKPYVRNFYGWTGPYFLITNFKEIENIKLTQTRKRYSFININAYGQYSFYFIELSNENANSTTTFNDFIDGSTLTFFKYGWSEI